MRIEFSSPLRTALAVVLLSAWSSHASQLQVPFVGPRDTALLGNVVASPSDGASILLTNPAGAAGIRGPKIEAGGFLLELDAEYENPEIRYRTSSSELAVAPAIWIGLGSLASWSVGFGLYGTTGASFNFPGSPASGVPNRFLTELSVLQLGLVAGREIAPGLRLGIELSPTYGRIRSHFGSPLGPVEFDTDGFGVGGTAGLLYEASDALTLGLAYRSPGIVYLRGDGRVNEVATDADADFHLPQSVVFGGAYHLTPSLTLLGQARWTDYPMFEDGSLEFSNAPVLDRPFFRHTKARFRYGASVEYAFMERVTFRTGFSREDWMIGEQDVSPLLFDNSDLILCGGLGVDLAPFRIDTIVGMPFYDDRVVTSDRNPGFPGRYQQSGMVWGLGVTYRFG